MSCAANPGMQTTQFSESSPNLVAMLQQAQQAQAQAQAQVHAEYLRPMVPPFMGTTSMPFCYITCPAGGCLLHSIALRQWM
jgi:hypothetical protein